ncbi:MAG: LPXTG cell wall anchor domain-containing protein, partial [Rhodoglobus sp.]
AAAGEAATIVVGAAGVSAGSGPTAGGATVVTLGATTTADGGIAGGFFTPGYCIAGGSGSVYVSVGNGAGGIRGADGSDCATAFVPGVNPSLGNGDSAGTLVPAALASIATEFGAGGKVLIAPTALTSDLSGTGQGADVRYVAVSTVPTFNATGGSGRVIFTYVTTALLAAGGSAGAGGSATALPATGTEIAAPLGIAGIAAALGALFLALARRRSAKA